MKKQCKEIKDGSFVIVRTYSAGVFAGTLEGKQDKQVVLSNARRLWYWVGANSLSELAVNGTKKPESCKFPIAVPIEIVTEAIEIILCTEKGKNSIMAVEEWSA